MSYVLNTPDDQQAMLKRIGVDSIEALFQQVPATVRLNRPLAIPPALSEIELTQHMQRLAGHNQAADTAVCFLGGGSYDHFIPAVVDAVAGRSEFYTAYTPYQAEASQGSLQAFFEFQTLICQLTGLDVANASLYEGGSGVAEAVIMAFNVTPKRHKVLIAESVHPEYRLTLATYLANLDAQVVTLPTPHGTLDPDALRQAIDDQTVCVVVQHPNFFGCLEEVEAISAAAHARGALFIVSFDPISLGLLKRPGQYGADIAVAEGQSLGNPMTYGGPYLGLLACREEYVRKIPGRLVGETTDRNGKRCWVLTLQTREQHIRQFDKPFFKEFTIDVGKETSALLRRLLESGYHAGLALGAWYPQFADCITLAVTEKRTRAEIDGLAASYNAEKQFLTNNVSPKRSEPFYASAKQH